MERLTAVFKPESKYRAYFLSVMTFSLAYGLYKGVIDSYLAEIVGMSGFDKGVSEFFRELPGLLLVFILAACTLFQQSAFTRLERCSCWPEWRRRPLCPQAVCW